MFEEFYNEMKRYVPEHARIMSCQFRGDPNDEIPGKWKARVLGNAGMVDDGANVYLCVSAMQRNDRDEFRRRKENFAGGLLLMIDDIGAGKGSKWPLSVLDPLQPTALIETSPGNFQAMYFFDRLVTDMNKFDALIRAFIHAKFLDTDTGQAGVNRVFRPPAGVNGKAKYGGWKVRLAEWNPHLRYSPAEIADAFGLKVEVARPVKIDQGYLGAMRKAGTEAFVRVWAALDGAGMLRGEPDYSDWTQMRCPWVEEHTGGVDSGAAIRLPKEENQWQGGFRCHHGHCIHKGWRDLTHWLAESDAEMLAMTNENSEPRLAAYKVGERTC